MSTEWVFTTDESVSAHSNKMSTEGVFTTYESVSAK